MPSSSYEFILYVDEAGDAGVRPRAGVGPGSTEWFAMGGVVIARRHELQTPSWVRGLQSQIGMPPSGDLDLHYNTLDEQGRVAVAKGVSDLPLLGFVVLSHKENMRNYSNARAARAGGKNVFYNFCLRVLLERVTHQVAHSSTIRFGEVRRLKVVIAETGGVKYDHTMEYIEKLRAQSLTGRTFLNQMTIHPKVASGWQIEKVSAKSTAGCQLADVVASAFYNGVNEHSEMPMLATPAIALERIVPRRGLTRAKHGVTLLPWNQEIPYKHRPFLAKFGYKW